MATPANALSLLRLLIAPVVVAMVLGEGRSWSVLGIWIALAATDVLDGWMARRQGATRSGAFLDPLADKFLVLGALGALAAKSVLPLLPVCLIAAREVGMSFYRSLAARRGRSVPASSLGKVKTWGQMLAVSAALVPGWGRYNELLMVLVWAVVVLTLASGIQYGFARS